MDPLSVTASIGALIGLASSSKKFYSRLRRFAEDVKLYDEDLDDAILTFQLMESAMYGIRDSFDGQDYAYPPYKSQTLRNLVSRNVFAQLTVASKKFAKKISIQRDRFKKLQGYSAWRARLLWATKEKAATKALLLAFRCIETPFAMIVNLISLELNKLAISDRMTPRSHIKSLEKRNNRLTQRVQRYEKLVETLSSQLVSVTPASSPEAPHEVLKSLADVIPSIQTVVPITLDMAKLEIRPGIAPQGPTSPHLGAASRPEHHTAVIYESGLLRPGTSSSISSSASTSSLSSVHSTHDDMPDEDELRELKNIVHVTPEDFSPASLFHTAALDSIQADSCPLTAVVDAELRVNLISIKQAALMKWEFISLGDEDPKKLVYTGGRQQDILFKCRVLYSGPKRGSRGNGTETVFFVCAQLDPEMILGEQFTWLGSDDRDGRTYLSPG